MEIVVASGKGGTGKTTVSAFLFSFFSSFLGLKVVGVDADVEAPDMLIALGKHRITSREPIYESFVAEINYDKCTLCKECYNVCQFGAIEWNNKPKILEMLCDGCGACKLACPEDAIKIRKVKTGDIVLAETKYGRVITGELEIGRKYSGKLVEMLRRKARSIGGDITIIDAAAGTGCTVISSIAGSDMMVVVVEPTRQSLRTAKKIVEIGKNFGVWMGLVVNKADINKSFVGDILSWAKNENIIYLGEIPYDKSVIEAYVNIQSLLDYAPNSSATKALENIARKVYSFAEGKIK